ncbi:dihydrofolate reductase family protein [Rhodococcus sp. NPDC003994]
MRELIYYVATSLDGFIAAPDGTWGAFADEGDHMAVLFDEYADMLPGHVRAALGINADPTLVDTVIMGWNTYTPALDAGIDSPYPHLRQIVASRSRVSTSPDVAVTADPMATVRDLRREGEGGIYLAGGGALAGTLIDEIDRLILKLNPVVLGEGIPLFGGAPYADRRFRPTRTHTFDSGVVIAEYVRADV